MRFSTNIHGPLRMNPAKLSDPQPLLLVPPAGQNLSNALVYDQMVVLKPCWYHSNKLENRTLLLSANTLGCKQM